MKLLLILALSAVAFGEGGCATAPAVAGYFTSGGVTLYKKATESGPKAEFVLIKFEPHHDVINPSAQPASK